MAERVFVDKLANVGLTAVQVLERRPFSLEEASGYALFTPDLVQFVRAVLPPEQRSQIAVAVTVSARKPRT